MTTALAFGLAVGIALAYALLRCFRTLWVDQVRHKLFCVRDDLFLYAVDNGLLEHPAYARLREISNTFIRYAHVVSFARIAGLTALSRIIPPEPADGEQEYQKALRSLPAQHREEFEQFHTRIVVELFRHLYRSTLLLRVSHALALPLLWINGWTKGQNGQPPAPSPKQAALIERDALAKCAA